MYRTLFCDIIIIIIIILHLWAICWMVVGEIWETKDYVNCN
jgi:hypothetical protein